MSNSEKRDDVDPIQGDGMDGMDGKDMGEDVEIIPPDRTKRDKQLGIDKAIVFVPSHNEQAMLDVLLDPFHRLSSVSRQCEIAGISRATYYRILQNEAFVTYYRDRLNDVIKAQGGQLINIGIREARKGSFPHWKVLMEMGGFYGGDKKDVSVDGELVMKVSFADPDDDGE